MQQTFLILGREPSISFAELCQVYGEPSVIAGGIDAVLIESETAGSEAPVWLGGIPKAGTVVGALPNVNEEAIGDILEEHILGSRKFNFGISSYALNTSPVLQPEAVKKLGIAVKRVLKKRGHSVRFVESKSGNLSSVDVAKNRLLEDGIELCLLNTSEGLLYGITRAVQPFEEYANRDYSRPGRDARRGMLPPKLARTMVNLSGVSAGGTILDPFCGVGTILQEAMLLNYKTIGTDIDGDAISATVENINWLRESNPSLAEERVETLDVRSLNTRLDQGSVDAVVSEFDLGPPLSGDEQYARISVIERELSSLYVEAFDILRTVLRSGGRAVVAWPYFRKQGVFVSALEAIAKNGWQVTRPYSREYESVFPLSERGTLIYGRNDQRVFREILILKKG